MSETGHLFLLKRVHLQFEMDVVQPVTVFLQSMGRMVGTPVGGASLREWQREVIKDVDWDLSCHDVIELCETITSRQSYILNVFIVSCLVKTFLKTRSTEAYISISSAELATSSTFYKTCYVW